MLGPFFRTFSFMCQVLGMIRTTPSLLAPFAINMAVAVPLNVVLAILAMLVADQAPALGNVFIALGLTALYFVDYFCAGLATSMVYDQVTTGSAPMGQALSRTLKSSVGIILMAAISAFFDMLQQWASQQRGFIKQILIGIVRSVWTTAVYVLMPAMVIEGIGFFAALKRSKQLMENDPTQVGVGYVAIGFFTWLLSAVLGAASFAVFNALMNVNVLVALFAGLTLTNLFWAISNYIRSVYYTCYYLWARECEKHNQANPNLAPAPLKAVLGELQGQQQQQAAW